MWEMTTLAELPVMHVRLKGQFGKVNQTRKQGSIH